jgi:hypothetical protein
MLAGDPPVLFSGKKNQSPSKSTALFYLLKQFVVRHVDLNRGKFPTWNHADCLCLAKISIYLPAAGPDSCVQVRSFDADARPFRWGETYEYESTTGDAGNIDRDGSYAYPGANGDTSCRADR